VFLRTQTIDNQRRELKAVAARSGWDVVAFTKMPASAVPRGREQRPDFDRLKDATARKISVNAAWSECDLYLTRIVEGLFAPFPLDEGNKAQRARAVDQRARVLAEWLDAQATRDCNSDRAWFLKPCPSLMFINVPASSTKNMTGTCDTRVMLLDRAGCDLLTICDITGHLLPKRADHREALPCTQCQSCQCRHRPARVAGARKG
jgi:hypothetical protein